MDSSLPREVWEDQSATGQALTAVAVASAGPGFSQALNLFSAGHGFRAIPIFIGISLVHFLGWMAWALFIHLVGNRIFQRSRIPMTYGSLVRTLGFSASPGTLRSLSYIASAILPPVDRVDPWVLLCSLWILVAMMVPIRASFTFGIGGLFTLLILGWFTQNTLITLMLGGPSIPTS